jgi:hypothetical protein
MCARRGVCRGCLPLDFGDALWIPYVFGSHACLCGKKYSHASSHKDVWDIPDYVRAVDNQVFASKLNMAQQLLYNPILGIVKASIILFLLRLGDRRWFIRYGLIAFFIFK